MRKIMYNRVLFILHKKNAKPSHFVIEKEVFWFTLKRNSFRGFKNAELVDHCSFYKYIENFGFVLFHVKKYWKRLKRPLAFNNNYNNSDKYGINIKQEHLFWFLIGIEFIFFF